MMSFHFLFHSNNPTMALLDHEAVRVHKERQKAYDDLKAELKWKSSLHDTERTLEQRWGDLNVSDAGRAHQYLEEQEKQIAAMQERINKYEAFFTTLRDLTPRQYSIYDNIG